MIIRCRAEPRHPGSLARSRKIRGPRGSGPDRARVSRLVPSPQLTACTGTNGDAAEAQLQVTCRDPVALDGFSLAGPGPQHVPGRFQQLSAAVNLDRALDR